MKERVPGEIADFHELFNDFYVPLCIFAERYVENKDEAADIVQDIFIKFWQQKGEFESQIQVKAFLYTSIRNAALNVLEHRRVTENYSSQLYEKQQDAFFHDHVIEEESYRILIQAINKLTDQPRKVILLALSGKSNKEIAEELSISEGTVHTHKKIAYKRLREGLKDYFYLFILFFAFRYP